MSDILSQEEIDRLLNAASTGAVGGGSAIMEEELDQESISALSGIANQILVAANSTISTLIARPAEVGQGIGAMVPASAFDNAKTIVVKAPFRSGFTGEISFTFQAHSAAALADMILGGDGIGKTDLAEGDDDAVKELFNQILGNAAPAITSSSGIEVGFDSVSMKECPTGTLESTLGRGKLFVCAGRMKVDEVLDESLRVIIGPVAAAAIAQAMTSEMEAEPEPVRSTPSRAPSYPPQGQKAEVRPFPTSQAPQQDIRNIDLILDIEVEVMVRLGNAQMPLREIQKLRPGSIIDLDRDTDALVELVVNDRIIAKGELVVVSSDHFALRVTEIVTQTERIRSLGGE